MNKKMMKGVCLAVLAGATIASAAAADSAPELNKVDHIQYISGYTDGTFRPDGFVTRAETAKMMTTLLSTKASVTASFSDVENDDWFYSDVSSLAGLKILTGYENGTFRPLNSITRVEFLTIISRFGNANVTTTDVMAKFSDLPQSHWAWETVQKAVASGWVSGYSNGTIRPDSPITRAEAVKIINQVLGRSADKTTIEGSTGIRIMPDVPTAHWAYYPMMEATTDHTYEEKDGIESWTDFDLETTPLSSGWHNIAGELYHVNSAQQFDFNMEADSLELDRNGRYTTGSDTLDKLLTDVAAKTVTDGMTQMEKLHAMYDYAKKTFGYLPTGTVETGSTGWELEKATEMLQTNKGNCYSWSAGFTYLARKVGYPAVAVAGTGISPKGSESVHAWTEIMIDGTAYSFDPQIESIYASRYNEKYDLFMKEYGMAEWGYKKDAASNNNGSSGNTGSGDSAVLARLRTLMGKVYEGVSATFPLDQTEITAANQKNFLGTDAVSYTAGLASEPKMTSIAHSIVLIELPNATGIDAIKQTLQESVDPQKWVCVGVDKENVLVGSVGTTICIVMDNDNAQKYMDNFMKAAK